MCRTPGVLAILKVETTSIQANPFQTHERLAILQRHVGMQQGGLGLELRNPSGAVVIAPAIVMHQRDAGVLLTVQLINVAA